MAPSAPAPEESLAAWLELGPAFVALTRGAPGPVILARQGRMAMAPEPVTVADSVGAGDSFMAKAHDGGRSRRRASARLWCVQSVRAPGVRSRRAHSVGARTNLRSEGPQRRSVLYT
ncbi:MULTISPECIES: PfkB family carbohydrate kinase [unclassified Arthrobacter]|uniref:PfkB family carbohydrate kinase n=1 Tax=unclassified Pseudarthrobacter TaxID=2647000 RepID=UPI003390D45B